MEASKTQREHHVNILISPVEQSSIEVNIGCIGCMQKVPAFLRYEEENNHKKRDYDPVVVSFGPYHHGKPHLMVVEDFKYKALEKFADSIGKDAYFLHIMVLEIINKVRRCYIEISTDEYDDFVFAQMMLMDACLIIYYIEDFAGTDQSMNVQLGDLTYGLIIRDMYLLENQIPYWFLKLLINLKYDKDEGEILLKKHLSYLLFLDEEHIVALEEQEEPLHLLEAFRKTLIANNYSEDKETNRWCWSICERLSLSSTITSCKSFLSKYPWIWNSSKRVDLGRKEKEQSNTLNSVTELKTKGIHLRPSPTDYIRDIRFKSFYFIAIVQLPTLKVTNSTRALFLNMMAFEMCPINNTDLEVSTYINFMKSLIQSPKDVTELRDKRILFNWLGTDEEVMQMFRSIRTYGVDNGDMFQKVSMKALEHYHNKAKTWLAELIHTYLRSPWSAIALFAAGFLLCLTFLQTYFTIHPTSN